MKRALRTLDILTLALLVGVPVAAAQDALWGRLSLFTMAQSASYDNGTSSDFSEVRGSLRLRSTAGEEGGFEYSLDARGSAYPSTEERSTRSNVYDAWIGGRTAGDRLVFRAGQMRITELGALGSIGGAMAEVRMRTSPTGRLRFGLFGGLEPKHFETGYVTDVKKGGVWAALDGANNRRHVIGYVLLRDAGLTERSVLTTTNYIPVGKQFFLYQAAQYDLDGPGGAGSGGLNYVFANMRWLPVQTVELMGNYHHGRSIDTRSITEDILAGRPVDQKALDGFLFESAGGRLTVRPMRNFRIWAGYASDRNNREDQRFGRVTAGLWMANIARSGLDLTVSDNRIDRPNGNYDAWYASLGRSFGRKVYASLVYSTSLSLVRIVGDDGVTIETRPRTRRYGLNALWHLSRAFSLNLTAEELQDDNSTDDRGIVGLTYRF